MRVAQWLFNKNRSDSAQGDKRTHQYPKHRAALLAFAFLESVAAMTGIAIGAVMRFGIDESAEASEDLFGIQRDKTRIGSDKTTHERLRGQLGILIPFERMQGLDPDLGGRSDLLDGDSALFALLAQELA
jgi:hypothetical protein